MRISRIEIKNFRGIKDGELFLTGRSVLVGDNNIGKSTILEAIDLVLGPERLARSPVIDEHDFYAGEYLDSEDVPVEIFIETVIVDLSAEQQRHFRNHLEWWDSSTKSLIEGPPPEVTDKEGVVSALRVCFKGKYDIDEDDFIGKTFFMSPQKDDTSYDTFASRYKRLCGFLFLRTLRTGYRALSLERGSLLDVILRLNEMRVPMWEEVLNHLRELSVSDNPDLGVSSILSSVQTAVRAFVPSEWGDQPHFRVSDLTRADLRRVLTLFMGTGAIRNNGTIYAAPFQHQGTGTINTLVLALLSMIADLKQNVIFAMEEPEIAIPPYTQKRIIQSVSAKSAQAIFTSHSPYILEEFDPNEILVINRTNGKLGGMPAAYPPAVKPKKYRDEFRRRFCEALLSRKVLIMEGRTEYDALPATARKLHEIDPQKYKTLEQLGLCIINADTDSQVAPLGAYFRSLGKATFAFFDKQDAENKAEIDRAVDYPFESQEKGFEDLVIKFSAEGAIRRYALFLVANGEWPQHINTIPSNSMGDSQIRSLLRDYFIKCKGSGVVADFLGQCSVDEIPKFILEVIQSIHDTVNPPAIYQVGEDSLQDADETILSVGNDDNESEDCEII